MRPTARPFSTSTATLPSRTLSFSGAIDAANNGAGVRYEAGNLVIDDSYFHDNQDGLLSAASPTGTITINNSEFTHNGRGDGYTHNLYVGAIAQLTVTNSLFQDAVLGHEIKSRALNNSITNNRIEDLTGNASYSIDLPNGGVDNVSGNVIEKGANAPNQTIIHFGGEGTPYANSSLTVSGNTIVNDRSFAYLVDNAANAPVSITGNQSWGLSPAQLAEGSASIGSGTFLSSRPAVDSTSLFGGNSTPASTFPVITVGSGPDTLAVSISEDAYQGDAQFTLAVDGQQVGGVQTAGALQADGQSQIFDVLGSFAGSHTLTVDFLNDAYDGTSDTDRNLYVDGATINGKPVANSTVSEMSSGPQDIGFGDSGATTPPSGASYPPVTLGSGPDALTVGISEDAYQGDAQFTLAVDGQQIGGTETALAPHAAGSSQLFSVNGNFGAGPHTVAVDFLNDAYDGTPATDRNLYVDSLNYNGAESPTDTATLLSSGPVNLDVPGTVAAAPDTITFNLTEDAYQGDAQAAISLDGKVLGTPTVTFLDAAGTSEAFTYTGSFGPGPHTATVDFLNDAYGGSPALDRNLYVNSIDYDGVHHADLSAALYSPGPVDFTIPLVTPG